MTKSASTQSASTHGLWFQIGTRLRSRRTSVGLSEGAVSAHLGVSLERYREFECGATRVPAALLAQAGDLLKVPLFHFFQDLPFKEEDVENHAFGDPPVLMVATIEDRVAALTQDFLSAGPEAKSCLLLLARAFAREANSPD
jgi:transcriptional regulator with XRE-family HTH domain